MASISYCVIENTTQELSGVISKLAEGDVSDWSEYEIRHVKRLFEQCERILEYKTEILQAIDDLDDEEGEELECLDEDNCQGCPIHDSPSIYNNQDWQNEMVRESLMLGEC